ncbi:LysR family transcriptional regulator [Trinickia mobilis]|uniref:LysR family transcriptional regulator n=1 Tax=Trinickia mobilis TaxID=2816356 RepID=UPI001A900207|nr:LysR family transcriptional regulator [Trinickia mobilis]
MELLDLRVFAKVSELLSVSGAADALGLPKSTASRSLSRLEQHLGVALIYRSNRKISLTETGVLFAAHARKILDDVDDAEQKVGQIRHTPRGLLRVSAPVTPGQWMIAPLIGDYLRQYPEMEVSLSLTSSKVEPLMDEVDVVIHTGELEDSRLIAKRLGTASLKLLATPAYLELYGAPESPEALVKHALLDIATSGSEWRLSNGSEVLAIHVRPRFSANDTGTVRTVLLDGLGLGWLPDYLCKQDLAEGRLVHVMPGWARGDRDIHAVFSKHRTLSPKVRSFIDFLGSRFNK